MKKLIIIALCALLIYGVAFYALTNRTDFEMILHPQNPIVPENGVATSTVKAQGKNMIAQWFMHWNGVTYEISEVTETQQPWEPYAGTSYGAEQADENTFSYVFNGIGAELDGAYIWCVLHCGNFVNKTQVALIDVADVQTPPVITEIAPAMTVIRGDEVSVNCVVENADENAQLTYQWFITSTGKLEDIQLVEAETANTNSLAIDDTQPGVYYYVCRVETAEGGVAFSSVSRVTVTDGMLYDENQGSNFYSFVDEQDVVVEKAKESGGNNLWIIFIVLLIFGFGYSVYSFQKKAKEEA